MRLLRNKRQRELYGRGIVADAGRLRVASSAVTSRSALVAV